MFSDPSHRTIAIEQPAGRSFNTCEKVAVLALSRCLFFFARSFRVCKIVERQFPSHVIRYVHREIDISLWLYLHEILGRRCEMQLESEPTHGSGNGTYYHPTILGPAAEI
jgi:hypothetical protein